MFFSVITKNLSWEILTENLVNFKRPDGVKGEKCYMKNHYIGVNYLKKGAWIKRFKRG